MPRLDTALTDKLNIRHPILQGGMGPYKTERLAIAVSRAGALGVVSSIGMAASLLPDAAPIDPEKMFGADPPRVLLQKSIEAVTEALRGTDAVFGINIPVASEFMLASKMFVEQTIEARQGDSDVEKHLRVLVTSAGNPAPWSEVKKHGLTWIHVVPSVYHAKKAEKAGADIIVASGHEGGAHISWDPVHSMVLVPAVAEAVDRPVVAAGGFCDGKSMAAALCLGAAGIQMGTRFIATQESDFQDIWKESIIEKGERETLAGRGIFGPMRFLRNQRAEGIVKQTLKDVPAFFLGDPVESNEQILNSERAGFDDLLDGKAETALMFGGEVVGRVDNIPSVEQIVQEIIGEAASILHQLPNRVIKR
jgi:NAD(P)H-dependent flavin oxidoreductase YrpB (nitropropane dioxygenase family)